jgi:hypothetical protein
MSFLDCSLLVHSIMLNIINIILKFIKNNYNIYLYLYLFYFYDNKIRQDKTT